MVQFALVSDNRVLGSLGCGLLSRHVDQTAPDGTRHVEDK